MTGLCVVLGVGKFVMATRPCSDVCVCCALQCGSLVVMVVVNGGAW